MTTPDHQKPVLHKAVQASTTSTERSRVLRDNATPPERVLWSRLRRKQLGGFRFRRQHPLGPYIADIYCDQSNLVIEIDGSTHQGEQRLHDNRRDAWMAERGLVVLRFTTSEITKELDAVLRTILRCCRDRIE